MTTTMMMMVDRKKKREFVSLIKRQLELDTKNVVEAFES
jgi:hypothetical protein